MLSKSISHSAFGSASKIPKMVPVGMPASTLDDPSYTMGRLGRVTSAVMGHVGARDYGVETYQWVENSDIVASHFSLDHVRLKLSRLKLLITTWSIFLDLVHVDRVVFFFRCKSTDFARVAKCFLEDVVGDYIEFLLLFTLDIDMALETCDACDACTFNH